MPTVIHRTREELKQQRAQLLERVGMTDVELAGKAETYALSMDQLIVWQTIEDLDYLLSGDC